jgi:hypothetical protein
MVEVVRFIWIARFATHDTIFVILQNLTIVVQEVQQDMPEVDVLRHSNFVQLPELYESYNHKQEPIRA